MSKHFGQTLVGLSTFAVLMAVVVAMGFFGVNMTEVSAHEERETGDFEIVFGWQVEPAYSGVFNGPEITITDMSTGEPVVGAEETLTLTVSFGRETKELTLEPAWNEPGRYVAFLTPTRPGDYEFEITGSISVTTALSETAVSEIFSSADGDFSTIEPAADILFPDADTDVISLQSQVDDLKEEIEALKAELAELSEAGQ